MYLINKLETSFCCLDLKIQWRYIKKIKKTEIEGRVIWIWQRKMPPSMNTKSHSETNNCRSKIRNSNKLFQGYSKKKVKKN